ncbi:MAG: amidohydrolase family protein [Myxococcota bacterium]
MKIDIHGHILPKNWPDLRERYGYGGFIRLEHDGSGRARMMRDGTFFREVEANLWDAQTRIQECDHHRVDVQVLSTVPVMFSYWAKPEHTLDISRILNDDMAEVIAGYPKRFVGLGTIPMNDPPRAALELERCRTELGFAGVQIATHINGVNLDDEQFEPVWAAAEQHGAAILVHPWDMMGMDQMPDYWLPWLVSMPAETSRAICSLMMGGVIEKYPKLRFAFSHGGGSFPGTIGRISHGFKMRPDLCQVRTTTQPRDLLDRIVVDSIVLDRKALEFLVELMGAEHIALGTDYPFPLGELEPGQLIETTKRFTPEQKERMLSGTALEWLGLERSNYETEASRLHSESLYYDPWVK